MAINEQDVFNSRLAKGAKFRGVMELPELPIIDVVPDSLTEFRRLKAPKIANQFIHFYIPDKKFESVYRSPERYVSWFKQFGGIIGFDFSLYAECPIYKQVESIGRNRELSFWFSKQGIKVIPNVRWGLKETFAWCFDGLPKRSTVAVSTLGCVKEHSDKRLFEDGFLEMLTRIEPKTVVVYGTKSEKLFPPLFTYMSNTALVYFESNYTISHRKEVA
jgi:hypothetical protein